MSGFSQWAHAQLQHETVRQPEHPQPQLIYLSCGQEETSFRDSSHMTRSANDTVWQTSRQHSSTDSEGDTCFLWHCLICLLFISVLSFRFCRVLQTTSCLQKKSTWDLLMTLWRATLIQPGGKKPEAWYCLNTQIHINLFGPHNNW